MNSLHFHLIVNHFPLIGTVIGVMVLLAGSFLKEPLPVKRIALGIFVFSALTAIPAYLTGGEAEEAVENMSSVSGKAVEKHEEITRIFFIIIEALGVISLLALLADLRRNRVGREAYAFILLLSLVTALYGGLAGNSGGMIRHTEVKSGSLASPQDQPDPLKGNEDEEQ